MALEPAMITAHEGDVYCRQANGLDVAKFFLFNYGLHALTVITEPGSGALETTFAVFQAVLYPYAGMSVALSTIYRGARFKGTPLQQAKRAGALCMAVHATDAGYKNRIVDIYLKNVHGQFSRPSLKFNWSILRRLCQKPTIDNNKLVLVEVPDSLTVEPPIGSASELSELVQVNGSVTIEPPTESISETPEPLALELACNYSLFKVFAAICQTVYGAIELFNSRGRQLDTYGYAAYALTVVPYILMSLVNLLATICQPQYPSMFIVTYEGKLKPGNRMMDELPFAGENSSSREQTELAVPEVKSKIGGTVGIAYGLVQVGSKPRVVDRIWENLRVFWKLSLKEKLLLFAMILLFFLLITIPYVIMKLMTNFESRQSTKNQRQWILMSLSQGQCWGPYLWFRLQTLHGEYPLRRRLVLIAMELSYAAGSIGGFVVVGDMLLQDIICHKL